MSCQRTAMENRPFRPSFKLVDMKKRLQTISQALFLCRMVWYAFKGEDRLCDVFTGVGMMDGCSSGSTDLGSIDNIFDWGMNS